MTPSPPKKAPPARRGSSSPVASTFKYRPQFGIVVLCEDELDQRGLFQMLEMIGLKLKVVSV